MSWVRIWVHLVFSTKNREPYLNSTELREKVFTHIKENAKKKDIWLDICKGLKPKRILEQIFSQLKLTAIDKYFIDKNLNTKCG